jgi:RimJ/RimL family protein N-acetyltransferase
MAYYKKIAGKKCYLSPIDMNDAEKFTGWLNDPEVTINLDNLSRSLTLEEEKEFLQSISKSNNMIFGIIDNSTDKIIGTCGLHGVNYIDGTAEFGIFIGDKDSWGKGFGMEATRLIIDYGFSVLNLHNIYLRVFEFNKRAIRVYEKCGFKVIGKRREAKRIAGKRYSVIFMDILANEHDSIFFDHFLKNSIQI